MSEQEPPVNGQPPAKKPRRPPLGVLRQAVPVVPVPAHTEVDTPPPAFGQPDTVPEQDQPLPAPVAPSKPSRRRGPVASTEFTVYDLLPRYQGVAPPGLEGLALAKWVSAVQKGELLKEQEMLQQVQELAGLSAVQIEVLEKLQAVFEMIAHLGTRVGELVELLRNGERLPPAPVAPARPIGARAAYQPGSRQAAVASTQAEESPAPDTQAVRGQPGQVPVLTEGDADAVIAFALSRVPVPSSPMTADEQRELVRNLAIEWLDRWAQPGHNRPDRWRELLNAAVEQAFFPQENDWPR